MQIPKIPWGSCLPCAFGLAPLSSKTFCGHLWDESMMAISGLQTPASSSTPWEWPPSAQAHSESSRWHIFLLKHRRQFKLLPQIRVLILVSPLLSYAIRQRQLPQVKRLYRVYWGLTHSHSLFYLHDHLETRPQLPDLNWRPGNINDSMSSCSSSGEVRLGNEAVRFQSSCSCSKAIWGLCYSYCYVLLSNFSLPEYFHIHLPFGSATHPELLASPGEKFPGE